VQAKNVIITNCSYLLAPKEGIQDFSVTICTLSLSKITLEKHKNIWYFIQFTLSLHHYYKPTN